jgi:CheY-like chemotaxis protein
VFWFELNRSEPPVFLGSRVEPAPERLAEVTVPAAAAPEVRTVLYVEDNPANLELVGRLLGRRSDLVFLSAGDATQGFALARQQRPDVILMDINLPGMSGIRAMGMFQDDEATAGIPVLAVSANAMAGDIAAGLDAGFFRYLTKPIHIQEFMTAIDEALALASGNLL